MSSKIPPNLKQMSVYKREIKRVLDFIIYYICSRTINDAFFGTLQNKPFIHNPNPLVFETPIKFWYPAKGSMFLLT